MQQVKDFKRSPEKLSPQIQSVQDTVYDSQSSKGNEALANALGYLRLSALRSEDVQVSQTVSREYEDSMELRDHSYLRQNPDIGEYAPKFKRRESLALLIEPVLDEE